MMFLSDVGVSTERYFQDTSFTTGRPMISLSLSLSVFYFSTEPLLYVWNTVRGPLPLDIFRAWQIIVSYGELHRPLYLFLN